MAIELWAVRLDRPFTEGEQKLLLTMMPEERRVRLLRAKRERWQEPLAAYGLLKMALACRNGLQEIPELCIEERGKPVFAACPVQFSLSHTSGAALVGLSDAPLGVDIERFRPPGEHLERRLTSEGLTTEAYFRRWVCYEAAVKKTGVGVSAHPDKEYWWEACPVQVFPGYYAAVCGALPVRMAFQGTTDLFMKEFC